jgi:hypothetical protein
LNVVGEMVAKDDAEGQPTPVCFRPLDAVRVPQISTQPRRSRKDYYNAWIAGELDRLDY